MDDLSGIDWSAKPSGGQPKPSPMMNPSYPSLQATPSPFGSGRSTPASTQGSNAAAPKPAPAKPAQDSFSNLVNFGPAKASQNLTLAERQAQLEAEKRKKEEEKRKLTEAQFGSGQHWDMLGSRGQTSSPSIQPPPPKQTSKAPNDDDDLFAAFNKDTEVDQSSYYPPPETKSSTPANGTQLDLTNPSSWAAPSSSAGAFAPEDDDPFGLSEMKSNGAPAPSQPQASDDDDFLGDLGRPVDEVRRKQEATRPQGEPGKPIEDADSSSSEDELPIRQRDDTQRPKQSSDPAFDRAVAQLVDYGFGAEDSRRALVESGAGTNVQAAANWLLDEAHRKAKEKAQGRSSSANSGSNRPERREQTPTGRNEPDFAKSAAAVGNSLFKTANSLWKTGQKRMQQAVADFQQEEDPSQPRWMREAQQGRTQSGSAEAQNATDEARMLDSGGRPPKPARSNSRQATPQITRDSSPATSSANQSRSSSVPRWQQQSQPPLVSSAKSKLGRFADDDDTFAVSTSRHRKPTAPTPPEPRKSEPEPDLLFGSEAPKTQPERPARREAAPPPPKKTQATPTPPRKSTPVPPRQVPSISPSALQTSNKHRLEGTAHFKRGDFAAAHSSYSASFSAVPPTHPLAIVLLTNRALTALKTGEPKQAVTDADEAIKIIGPGNGQGEKVAITGENGQEESRDMRELYGKALTRKAEALEQMEKWADAGSVWQLCVQAGVGGATAIKGRQRCQNALAPKPKPKPAAAKPKPRPTPSASASLAPQQNSEAVERLRLANEAAAKEDDEKFALADKVNAKVAAWRDGKRDNLRGLLASLEQVLWEDSGWKKVGMHELVMANKVKIVYMKAIAKTHPDKVRHRQFRTIA